MCLGTRTGKQLVHTLTAVHDSVSPASAEKYTLPGEECGASQSVCFGPLTTGEDQLLEEALHCEGRSGIDQVFPLPQVPSGSDLPNVSRRMSMTELEDECRFNPGKLQKVRKLSEAYSHWRPIRGDGNCYYRTVIFGALEALVASGDRERLRNIVGNFQQVTYEQAGEQRAHEQMLRQIRSWQTPSQVEQWVAQDAGIDQALVRACRRLVRIFLVRHAEKKSPSGMTYSELAKALGGFSDIEEFCSAVIDPMGRDAETLALNALPHQLGIGLRLWILDRRDEVDLVSQDTMGPDGKVDVHALFKPGHYDLLYLRHPGPPLDVARVHVRA